MADDIDPRERLCDLGEPHSSIRMQPRESVPLSYWILAAIKLPCTSTSALTHQRLTPLDFSLRRPTIRWTA